MLQIQCGRCMEIFACREPRGGVGVRRCPVCGGRVHIGGRRSTRRFATRLTVLATVGLVATVWTLMLL